MAVKSILSIDVRDGQFKDFLKLYEKYESALKKAPAAWALVNKNIDGSKASFQKLVDQMAAANVQEKLREKAQERADKLTQSAAERWSAMARNTREFATNIGSATTSLLKWASITGVISGIVGAGGLFGIDRLALSAASGRRSSLGLGVGYGEQAAFGANAGRLVDPQAFLSAVAGAKFDVQKRVGLLGAGVSQRDIDGDTGQTAVALLRRLKTIADQTNPALFAQVLQGRRLDQFATPQDLNRLRSTSGGEVEQVIQQILQRGKQFELPQGVAKRWQDFTTQLDNAGKGIETVLIKGLVNLAPGLTKLSESVTRIAGVMFEKGGTLERWVTNLDGALEKFADYIGTEEFQTNVRDFVTGIGKIADAIADGLKWLGHGDPDLEASRQAQRERVGKLRQDRAEGKATALGQLGSIFSTGNITEDQLLAMVRQRERSGDAAVSPKGAVGRYQIMPGTALQYGADPSRLTDPKYSEDTARKILRDLAKRYHGNVPEVLAGYNGGPGVGDRYRSSGHDPRSLPAETQKYVTGSNGMVVVIENKTGADTVTSTNALKN